MSQPNPKIKAWNVSRAMLAAALAAVITGAVAQSSAIPPPATHPTAANPLIPAQTAVAIIPAPMVVPSAPIVAPPGTAMPPVGPSSLAGQSPPSQAPSSDAAAMAALQQSVNSQSAPTAPGAPIVRTGGELVTPYTVPAAGEGIYQGSSQTLREISYLTAEVDLADARTKREAALEAQAAAHTALVNTISGKKDDGKGGGSSGSSGGPMGGSSPAAIDPHAAAAALALAVKRAEPVPYINSVYSYGNDSYAEIVLGSNKVIATRGTMLVNGDRVVSISPSGVVVSGRHGRKTFPVRGSASISQ
jgi:hypothetical protein